MFEDEFLDEFDVFWFFEPDEVDTEDFDEEDLLFCDDREETDDDAEYFEVDFLDVAAVVFSVDLEGAMPSEIFLSTQRIPQSVPFSLANALPLWTVVSELNLHGTTSVPSDLSIPYFPSLQTVTNPSLDSYGVSLSVSCKAL